MPVAQALRWLLLWTARTGVFLTPLIVVFHAGADLWNQAAEKAGRPWYQCIHWWNLFPGAWDDPTTSMEEALPGWFRGIPLPDMFFPAITGKGFLFRYLVEVTFAAWIPLALADRRYRPRFSWPLVGVLAMVGAGTLATVFAVNPYRSFWSNCERMAGLVQLLHLAALFLVASSVLDSARLWRAFVVCSLLPSLVVCYALVGQWMAVFAAGHDATRPQYATLYFHQPGGLPVGYSRLDELFWSPVHAASYLMLHAFLGMLVFARRGAAAFRTARGEAANLLLCWVPTALLLVCMWQTGTTSAWIGTGLGLIAALFALGFASGVALWRRVAWILVLGFVVLAIAVLIVARLQPPALLQVPYIQRLFAVYYSSDTRLLLFEMAWRGFLERPLVGFGFESFGYSFDAHYDPWFYDAEKWWDYPHSSFFAWLTGAGLPGALAYVGVLVAGFAGIWSKRLADLRLAERSILTGMLVAWVWFHCAQPESQSANVTLFLLLAFLHARGRPLPPESPPSFRPAIAAIALPIAAVAAYFAIAECHVHARAAMALADALRDKAMAEDGLRQRAAFLAQQRDRLDDERIQAELRKGNAEVAVMSRRCITGMKEALLPRTLVQTEAREQMLLVAGGLRQIPQLRDELSALALRELEAEAESDPRRLRSQFVLGVFLQELGRTDDAMQRLELARQLSPRRQLVLQAIANLHLARGQRDEAMRILRQSWDLRRQSKQAQADLLIATIRLGDRATEDEVIAQARQWQDPFDPLPEVWRTWLQAGRADRVIELATPVVESARRTIAAGHTRRIPMLRVHFQRLSGAHAQRGETDQAIAILEEIMTFDPDFADEARQRIAELRRRKR